ncbi:Rv2578c family radical SAM protein [Arthrobacter sp. NPDC057259]|uniref:Rv2578c family radical SAM protein n=1 Tax=Arthrobacter sp. NPDC057259 TaxID=3346073 RepID=UPI00362E929D
MRWDAQALNAQAVDAEALNAETPRTGTQAPDGQTAPLPAPALLPLAGLVRSVTTPEFAGVTFHEVTAKSVLNKVAAGSRMPFEWTINPYRGCSHACVYCFARKTHTYLDFDAGLDFDSQVVVKVNAAEVLRRELAKPSWQRHQVALGTNTDPYQRAEGRYQLMPGIIRALADSGTPLSILTKGTLLARDIPLLKHAATQVPVGVGISLAMTDEQLSEAVEPGTPGPRARLKLISRLREAGLPCGVMAMPILPWLSDSDEALDSLFGSLAAAGATGVSAGALYLKPGTREWFMQWIAREHPQLAGKYRRLYGGGSYASKEYRAWLAGRVRFFKARHGFIGSTGFSHEDIDQDPRDEEARYPAGSLPGSARIRHGRGTAGSGDHSGTGESAAEPVAAQPTLF